MDMHLLTHDKKIFRELGEPRQSDRIRQKIDNSNPISIKRRSHECPVCQKLVRGVQLAAHIRSHEENE